MTDAEYRDAVARHYDTLLAGGDDPVLDPPELREHMNLWDGPRFIELMQLGRMKSVLEIGVGTGRLAVQTAPLCASFTGIDVAPDTLLRAQRHLREYEHVSLICGDFMTYEFGGKFDVIYSSLTWMHIRDKLKAVEKAAALLEPGGRFVLAVEREGRFEIDAGTTRIRVYPDDRACTGAYIRSAGLRLETFDETAFGLIYAAVKV